MTAISETDSLIGPADSIFNVTETNSRIQKAFRDHDGDSAALRTVGVEILSSALKTGQLAIAEKFGSNPFSARMATRSICWLTDCIVLSALEIATSQIADNSATAETMQISVFAVGGYGRGEMAPMSDIDLLFLTPTQASPDIQAVIESTLHILWDLGLKVGHSTRTAQDCIELGRDDFTIRTSLLEKRFLYGDSSLGRKFADRLKKELFKGTEREFIEAKLDERDVRHIRHGVRYMVEPNIKEGKGGLRDLQSLFWIAKYIYHVDDVAELVKIKLFTRDEFDTFSRAENFLWAVRCHLHFSSGRANDKLSFDMQNEVARRMGYNDTSGRRAVENFMQDYFRHATSVGDLTRILLTKLEALHVKSEPLLQRLFSRRRKLKPGYREVHGRLAIADEGEFLEDRLNLLRLFEEGLRTGLLIHPDAMRLVTANLNLINDSFRKSPEAKKMFLNLLLKHGNPERGLRRMNELGVLSAFIPDFEPVRAMMQYNTYHSYTVDEHIIQCISQLAQLERRELTEDLPITSSILAKGVNRRVLYVALLMHDIGKGRSGDHSILGAHMARKAAIQLGLKIVEVDTVEWLVRHHLLMSDIAQKRDITDPRTIRNFARAVQTQERLDLLCVLTACDIRGVGPNTWNNWKATLIRSLYAITSQALKSGLEEISRAHSETEAKKIFREKTSDWSPAEIKAELSRHTRQYWERLHVSTHLDFARLRRGPPTPDVRMALTPDSDRDATRACFVTADHPGVFSRMCGALALVGANVVDARTYTTNDGYATAAFWIQDAQGHPYEAMHFHRLGKMIKRIMADEIVPDDAIRSRDKIKKRERHFRVPTHITFDNEGSDNYTIIEVETRDRPGLLYDLTQALANANASINSAVIANYGLQAVDSFYIKDRFGLKFFSRARQKSLERKLRAAIERGAQWATV